MTTMENAVRDLMDALLNLREGLKDVDLTRSIDDNVQLTGVEERNVKAYLLGMRAINASENN